MNTGARAHTGRELEQGDRGMRADLAASTGLLVCYGNRGTGHLFKKSPGDSCPRMSPESAYTQGTGGKRQVSRRVWGYSRNTL